MSRLYPCVYCTEDGYCKKYSDDEVTSWCVQGPCKDEKPSNADRIRSMTDEELAAFLLDIDVKANNYGYEAADGEPGEYPLPEDWLAWLKQEVDA